VAEWFRQRGYHVFKAVGSTEPDLFLHTSVEVKRDAAASRTGNLAIEVAYAGKPSGLETTKAVWWVTVTDDAAFVCKVADLRRWLDSTSYPSRQCGDGERSLCVLIPLADYAKQKFVHKLHLEGGADAA